MVIGSTTFPIGWFHVVPYKVANKISIDAMFLMCQYKSTVVITARGLLLQGSKSTGRISPANLNFFLDIYGEQNKKTFKESTGA